MQITVSVAGPAMANTGPAQCAVSIEVEAIDQTAMERIAQAARQCEAIVRGAGHDTRTTYEHTPAVASPRRDNGYGGGKRLATEKQAKAINVMADRKGVDLGSILRDRFGVACSSALSIGEASSLIDELKNSLLAAK